MSQYRRVSPGQNPYLSVEEVRAEFADEAEDYPAAVEMLTQTLTALEQAGTPLGVTTTLARRRGAVEVGGRWSDGHDRILTLAQVGEDYDRCEHTGPDGGPLSLAEVGALIDSGDRDCLALLEVLRALVATEAQTIVEALAEGYPRAVVRTPDGHRFALTAADL